MEMTQEQREAVVTRMGQARGDIISHMVAALYQNPYWELRYGEKGRKYTRLDAEEQIKKLTYAVALDLPEIISDYFHWLQGLLVYRGMCTIQIQESIQALATAIAGLLPQDWPLIEPYLRASAIGLAYDHPACQALAAAESAIAAACQARHSVPLPAQPPAGRPEKGSNHHPLNVRYLLSYLYDGHAMKVEAPLVNYLSWLQTGLPDGRIPPADLQRDLAILQEELEQALSPALAEPFVQALRGAIDKSIPV